MGRLDGRLAWGRLVMDLAMGRLDGPHDGKASDGLLVMGRLGVGMAWRHDGLLTIGRLAMDCSQWDGSRWDSLASRWIARDGMARDGTARDGTAWCRDELLAMGRLGVPMNCLRWDGSRCDGLASR